jgi:hypothetical protein
VCVCVRACVCVDYITSERDREIRRKKKSGAALLPLQHSLPAAAGRGGRAARRGVGA